MNSEHGHTIKIVSKRTGLSAHVLRVWERRYGAVRPTRTPTNRRVYSDADVEKLRLLRQATGAGHSIGRIAGLSQEDLTALVEADQQYRPARSALGRGGDTEGCVSHCLEAVARLDSESLEEELARAAVQIDQPTLLGEFVPVLMERIGDLWESGGLRIADEHMATAAIRTFLGSVNGSQRLPPSAPVMVATTSAGQLHEIGALLAAATAAAGGWRVRYLGPNLPADEIAGAVLRNGARAVALSLVYPVEDPHVGPELMRLRQGLGDDVPILLGGRAAPAYADAIARVGGLRCEDLAAMRLQLEASQRPTRQ